MAGMRSVPACPFSGGGMKTDALTACPGFEPDQVSVGITAPATELEVSCRHLSASRSERGYLPGCHLPGGPPVSGDEALAILDLVRDGAGSAHS
jgi:hypothetical protein